MEIMTIIRKRYPKTVLKMKVSELDKTKCSQKFLSHNFEDDFCVYVRCDSFGNIIFRGKKEEYSILKED